MSERAPKEIYSEAELDQYEEERTSILDAMCRGYELIDDLPRLQWLDATLAIHRPVQSTPKIDVKPIFWGGSTRFDDEGYEL